MATGVKPRVRIRPGYLRCAMCGRDLPEEEYRTLRRHYGGREIHYRDSWCRPCHAVWANEKRKHLERTSPAYIEDRRRRRNAYYHEQIKPEREKSKRYMKKQQDDRRAKARIYVHRLHTAGFPYHTIAGAIGSSTRSVTRWAHGTGNPSADHIRRLNDLITRKIAILMGALPE